MTINDFSAIYFAMAAAYMITRIFKLFRKKDGASGYDELKQAAIKEGVYMPEIFGALTAIVLIFCAATWPISMFRMITGTRRKP